MSKKYHVFLPDNGSLTHKAEPEIGTALLFPSSLYHSVDENMNAEDRITVSFNTFFWKTKYNKVIHLLGAKKYFKFIEINFIIKLIMIIF